MKRIKRMMGGLLTWGAMAVLVMVARNAGAAEAEQESIGMMPKIVGIDFFNAVERGAREAADELGVKLEWDGPVTNDVTKQAQIVETWIARGVDAICIAPNDPDAIAPVLRKAKARRAAVVTYDADANPAARDFFVNQATYDDVAHALVDTLAEQIGPQGKYIYLTGSLTAVNQNIWMERMEKYIKEKYPEMQNVSPTPRASEEDQALATQVAIDILKTYPDLDGIFAMTSVALPGAAEALRKTPGSDVAVTGLSTPNSMRPYIKDGTIKKFVLWNPVDLGYLALQAAHARLAGTLTDEATQLDAGRLGTVQVKDHEILLGKPIVFSAENIDDFDF